ncbi:MAG: hypothetical protein HZA54_08980 [Planctomycetes bacterium]|nr:hypothetical protein [Planctomycetota bacterium]
MADDEMMDGYEEEAPSNDVYSFLMILTLILIGAGVFVVFKETSTGYDPIAVPAAKSAASTGPAASPSAGVPAASPAK